MSKPERKLKIAIIAPPWLSLYPGCYYGIENVVHHLATNLTSMGHHVELFSVSGTRSKVSKLHWYHEQDQYPHIHKPYHEVASVVISHLLYSLNKIRDAGDFDIIHDHNSFVGPAVLAYASDLPPVLHTLHEPFTDARTLANGVPDNRLMFGQFKSIKNLYFNTVSESQKHFAPEGLLSRIKGVVHNAIDPDEYTYSDQKDDYYTIVASIKPDKGQDIAAKACYELGLNLKIAGTIGSHISTPDELAAVMSDPSTSLRSDKYFQYFKNEVAPYLKPGQIEYIGKVSGVPQKRLYARAKAYLFPLDWEEPFGMSALDALASGTPVVAYNRGALPEIIQHGVNGFIVKNYSEFKHYLGRVGEIDPAVCRQSVVDRFSAKTMAENYVRLYRSIIKGYSKFRALNFAKQLNTRLLAPSKYPRYKGALANPTLYIGNPHMEKFSDY